MSALVSAALQVSYRTCLLTIHNAVTNAVRLSSVSIKGNNSKNLRALGRNRKSQSVCWDQRAEKRQLPVHNLIFSKSFCSERHEGRTGTCSCAVQGTQQGLLTPTQEKSVYGSAEQKLSAAPWTSSLLFLHQEHQLLPVMSHRTAVPHSHTMCWDPGSCQGVLGSFRSCLIEFRQAPKANRGHKAAWSAERSEHEIAVTIMMI